MASKKRPRNYDTLTGGTGDVNPQTLILKVVQSQTDGYTQTAYPLPIPRLPLANGKSMVLEFLTLQFDRTLTSTPTGGWNYTTGITTNPSPPSGANYAEIAGRLLDDPRVLSTWNQTLVASATNTGVTIIDQGYNVDLTDSSGHGILIATDSISMFILSAATGIVNTAWCRVSYRFKEVTLAEYIGIVQSQQ